MNKFFIVAGVVVTVLWIAAIAIITGVYVAVKYFGGVFTFGTIKKNENDERRDQ